MNSRSHSILPSSFHERVSLGTTEADSLSHYLIQVFASVLKDLGEWQALALLETDDPSGAVALDIPLAQVASVRFLIQNTVEDVISVDIQQRLRLSPDAVGQTGCWSDYFQRLKRQEVSVSTIGQTLSRGNVDLVFTKHPTESKRWSVLRLQRRLARAIRHYRLTRADDGEFALVFELLWRSGELFTEKPSLEKERENLMFYLREIFPEAHAMSRSRLKDSWQWCFPEHPLPKLPRLEFSSWVGGDRDGHPLVTNEVTMTTLLSMRELALEVLRREIEPLHSSVNFSSLYQAVPDSLCGPMRARGIDPEGSEPWGAWILSIKDRLHARSDGSPAYLLPEDFRKDLDLLSDAFFQICAQRLNERYVEPIRELLDLYGFHTAKLDIRQNSHTFRRAFAEMLEVTGCPDGIHYPEWTEDARIRLLTQELESKRPFINEYSQSGPVSTELLSTLRSLARYMRSYGPDGVGCLIVSMSQHLSDLLLVYLLARESGLFVNHEGQPACMLQVVPLFETLEDLANAPGILEPYLKHPVVRQTLRYLGSRDFASVEPSMAPQTLMLGYSDSNKDCGIWASQWSLYNTQKHLLEVSERQGVPIRFFHGRGGTIGRGSGPTNRFMEALPQSGLAAGFRLTEQGEVIAQKYNTVESAANNLSQVMAGAVCAQLLPTHVPIIERAAPSMQQVLNVSHHAYRALVEHPGFFRFFREATPIDAIEKSNIGSRPSRRHGANTLADLRAIPWVFSWNQCRFNLPGWYGVGSGLKQLRSNDVEGWRLLNRFWSEWPFLKYLLFNIESSIASASETWMRAYAGLVTDQAVRDAVLGMILEEYHRTLKEISLLLERDFRSARPRLTYTLNVREPLLKPLHGQQIGLLGKWRGMPPESSERQEALIQLLLNINAVAAGLKTTG